MTDLVVDASVATKWFVPEEHQDRALQLIGGSFRLLAPSFLLVEIASVAVQRVRRSALSRDEASELILAVRGMPITWTPDEELIADAARIALDHHPSIYDCLYAALAIRENCQLITADRRLYAALQPPFPETLLWIEDLPGGEPG